MLYIYNFVKTVNDFVCRKCHGIRVSAKLHLDEEESVRLAYIPHVCNPVDYNPEDFKDIVPKFVNSPNFEVIMVNHRGKSYPRLFVFSSEDLCCGDCHNYHKEYVYVYVLC